jgi:hypothetical protein
MQALAYAKERIQGGDMKVMKLTRLRLVSPLLSTQMCVVR